MRDANDILRERGPDALRDTCDKAEPYRSGNGKGTNDPRLLGFKFDDDTAPRPVPHLVRNLLPKLGVGLAGGQSSAGKTAVMTDLSVALASGQDYFGHQVAERVGVVYLAAEGAAGFANRLAAAKMHRGIDWQLPLTWQAFSGNLINKNECDDLINNLALVDGYFFHELHVRLGAILCDTMAAACQLRDENDNAAVSAAMRQLSRLSLETSTFVLGVHHFGKNESAGLRGASAWRAAPDIVFGLRCDRDENTGEVRSRTLWLDKSREGEERFISGFELKPHKLGEDEDGEPFWSIGVEPTEAAFKTKGKGTRESKSTRTFRESFNEALNRVSISHHVMGDGPLVQAANLERVRIEFEKRWATGEANKRKRADATRQAWKHCIKNQLHGYRTENTEQGELIWRI